MEGNLCDTSVVVKMDNNRDLDVEGIIREIECWYEEIAQKSKAEVDALYRTRVSNYAALIKVICTKYSGHSWGPILLSATVGMSTYIMNVKQ